MDNPLRAALKIFGAAVRGALDMVAAFWRPLLRQPEKQKPPVIERTKAPSSDGGRTSSTYKTQTKVETVTAKTDR